MNMHIHVGHSVPGDSKGPSDVACFGDLDKALEHLGHVLKDAQDEYDAGDVEAALFAVTHGGAAWRLIEERPRPFSVRLSPSEGPDVTHWAEVIDSDRGNCERNGGRVMSENLSKETCDTMGCRSEATHILTTPGLDSDDENSYTDRVCEPCGQDYMRRPALRASLAPMNAPAPQGGYTPCACRDCMDTAVSSDVTAPELCSACADAGCEAYPPALASVDHLVTPASVFDCQRDDAYPDSVGDSYGQDQCEGCGWETRNCACGG